jgi:AraC family transcriptional regulator
MQPEIVDRPATTLIGLRLDNLSPDGDMPRIGQLWERFLPRRSELPASEPGLAYGLNLPRTQERFDYLAGVAVLPDTLPPEGMTAVAVPAARYARFVHKGAIGGFVDTIAKVYGQWLPAAGFERAPGALIEIYGPAFKGPQNAESEFDYLVPVRP